MLYRDAGVERLRVERENAPDDRTADHAIGESEVQRVLQELGDVRLCLVPDGSAVDYTDGTN